MRPRKTLPRHSPLPMAWYIRHLACWPGAGTVLETTSHVPSSCQGLCFALAGDGCSVLGFAPVQEEERQAQKKVASVIERWESRSISADALRHMRDRATTGRCASSADDSASDAASAAQVPLMQWPV